MVRLYTDENVHGAIVRSLRARGIDLVTAVEDGRANTPDPVVLDRATQLGRVMFTCDDDMLKEAARRQRAGEPFSGVLFAIQQDLQVGECVEDLELVAKAGIAEEYANMVKYIPMR